MIKAETGSEASVKGRQAVWSWARWSKMSRQDGSDGGTTQGRIVGVPSQSYPAALPKDCQLIAETPVRLPVPALNCRQTKQRGPEPCSGPRPAGQLRGHSLCIRTSWVCLRWIRMNTRMGAFSRGCGSYPTAIVLLTKWQPSSSPRFARMDICLSRCQRLASPETRERECGEEGRNSISVRWSGFTWAPWPYFLVLTVEVKLSDRTRPAMTCASVEVDVEEPEAGS